MDIGEEVYVEGDGFTAITHPDSHEVISLIPGSATYKLWERRGELFAQLPAENSVDHFHDFISISRALEWLQHSAYREHGSMTPAKRKKTLEPLESSLKKTITLLANLDNATLDDFDGEGVGEDAIHELSIRMSVLREAVSWLVDGGIRVTKTNTRRNELHDIVYVLAQIYEQRTGQRPTHPSNRIRDRHEEGPDGTFYRLCEFVTTIVHQRYRTSLRHAIREAKSEL